MEPPTVTIAVRLVGDVSLETNLDTVIVDADARRVTLIWRAFTGLRSGPLDVTALRVSTTTAVHAPSLQIAAPSAGSYA